MDLDTTDSTGHEGTDYQPSVMSSKSLFSTLREAKSRSRSHATQHARRRRTGTHSEKCMVMYTILYIYVWICVDMAICFFEYICTVHMCV